MGDTPAIVIDKCVFIGECLSDSEYDTFFNFLYENPETGILTREVYYGTKKNINEILEREPIKRRNALKKFEGMKIFLRYLWIEQDNLQKNLEEVNNFFYEMPDVNNKSGKVRYFYRTRLIRLPSFYIENNFLPGIEDRIILAETLHLNEEPTYLATYDKHFLKKSISEKIEKQFGITCNRPLDILKNL
jgi:hypothetical protein